MGDGGDAVIGDQLVDQIAVTDVADDQRRRTGDDGVVAGRKVVEHDNALATVDEGMHHVAANIAGATGHQNGHGKLLGSYRRL